MNALYWVIIIAVLVVFYVLLVVRQKRQEKKNIEALNNFRVGDKVITHIGIYGRIKRIYNTTYGKVCTLEIGTTNKIDIEMDLRYIAGIDEKTAAPEEPKQPETTENKQEDKKESKKDNKKEEIKEEKN